MKKHVTIFILLFVVFPFWGQEKVLFIGNSLTYFHDIPLLFKQIANSKGKHVDVHSFTQGGAGLADHIANPALFTKINSEMWDIVIIQPGSGESGGVTAPATQTAQLVQTIINAVKTQNPCARIYLYEISNGVRADNNVPNYASYQTTQTLIKNTITAIAHQVQIPFIPAGEAFRAHYTQHQDLLLHPRYNDIHQNLNGAYMVACTAFGTIYQQPVFPSSFISTIPNTRAEYLQNVADTTVFGNPTEWLIGVYQPHALFSANVQNSTVSVTNHSTHYDSLSWDFNGEFTSTAAAPSYTFHSLGQKTITLTIVKNNCSYQYRQIVDITTLSTQETKSSAIEIYPNPFSEKIHIRTEEKIAQITLYDASGKKVFIENHPQNTISVSHLPKGYYILDILLKNGSTITKKMIK